MKNEALKTKTAKSIIKAINAHVKEFSTFEVDYSRWYIGVTNNPKTRKSAHKSINQKEPYFWQHFYCRSKNIALAIELKYHKAGMLETSMQGGTSDNSTYIYVYKKYPTVVD